MALQKQRRRLFRIYYSSTFTVVLLLLIAAIIASPADAVWQSYKDKRYLDIFIIAGVYVLTGVVALLILASRLYTNRTILAAIPKTYIPIEPEDLGKKVRKMIKEALHRNAVVVFNAKPKFLAADENGKSHPRFISSMSVSSTDPIQLQQQSRHRRWMQISHPGWSSPFSPDLPHLQYETVIAELPALIEAKAVSLAPPDLAFSNSAFDGPAKTPMPHLTAGQTFIPDGRVVDALQWPENMDFRGYIEHLLNLAMIQPDSLGRHFLRLYESARFSGQPLTETEFRNLMSVFAEVLRSMNHLQPEMLAQFQDEDSLAMETEDTESYETPTPASEHSSIHSGTHSSSSMSTAASWQTQRRYNVEAPGDDEDHASDSTRSLRTAPFMQPRSTPHSQSRSASRPQMTSRLPSGNSLRPTRSHASVRSQSSARSGGSVIRLAAPEDGPLNLPYVINMTDGAP